MDKPKECIDRAFWVFVKHWHYLCWKYDDGTIAVWHHVTPIDGCYGSEVELELPSNYFRKHTAEQFYEFIASNSTCCEPSPWVFDKEKEIEFMFQQLKNEKWIH